MAGQVFRELHQELSGLLTDDWLSNLANFSAAIYASMPDLNWCGFYLVRKASGPQHLKLGPFQGRPACLDISFQRGVCGAAARSRETIVVEDVHQFPGHIACDERSRSELVVPMIVNQEVIGVFDLDSPTVSRFSKLDAIEVEQLVKLLVEKTKWPQQI